MSVKANLHREFFRGGWHLDVLRSFGKNFQCLKITLEWTDVPDMNVSLPGDTGIFLEEGDVRELIPALRLAAIEAGIMPDESRLQGELAATKLHLADLQRAFNKLLESK